MPTDPFPKNDFSKASHHHHHHHPTQTMDPDYKPNFSNFSSPWAAAQFFREQHQQQQNSVDYGRIMAGQLMGQDCDQEDKGSTVCDDREAMFEKPLTPSDVGKLNRLVIPKQHAERYFPLDGSGGSCEPGEKGVQLSFEDEDGKVWRFRYSYWNSSQSYVLTKGWSRFVKEKRLDAGDIVSFQRERTSGEKLFIGWRRRDSPSPQAGVAAMQAGTVAVSQWGPGLYPALPPYPAHPSEHSIGEHYGGLLHAGEAVVGSSPTPNSKRLRLFGVNLDCPTDGPEPDLPGGGGGETHMIFSPLPFNGSGS